MASRICPKSYRGSLSLSRCTRKRVRGTAAEARMARMATVTINSTSVSPSCRPAPLRRGNLYCIIRALLNVYHGLRTGKIDGLLSTILNRSTDDLHARIPWRVGLEGQNANRSGPGHAADPRGAGD